ncbi:hypothetical protein JANAI62_24610 [Jannaschia pagri]|uniref:Asl1-like glycosyl hydrolase catalytic domain-containing protein n=1 Tax=Jannaschia pagri TaxID=2829797 RepID=A0ABQ4NN88_9RHOB|nr:hypothetical protein JANAI62_24610 [Jannaschia sp. AI_62]
MILGLLMAAPGAWAQDLRAPTLAAASNFGQGVPRGLFAGAETLGILDFRDAVYWDRVEGPDGRFRFTTPTTRWPGWLPRQGAEMTLTVNNGHPAYEGGATPVGPDAVHAFGAHAARVVEAFPAITGVEVGNEFNSANFVSGPLRDAGLTARAEAHAALTISVAEQVRAVRPEVRIIGAGVHSVPTGYLAQVAAAGGLAPVDAIALHPYDTPVAMLDRQIEVLRRASALAEMPIELTEFGTQSPDAAPGLLWRGLCKSALAGVSRLVWYPLHPRGDDYVPLLTRGGIPTATGLAYAEAQSLAAGKPVRDVSPDAATPACLFGESLLVIWGAPRQIDLTSREVSAIAPDGRALPDRTFTLSESTPLIVVSERPIRVAEDLKIAPQDLVADSFWHLFYGDTPTTQGPFARLTRSPNGTEPMTVQPGQGRPGVPWTPYLGRDDDPSVRLLSQSMLPSGTAAFPQEVLHRFTAPDDMVLALDLTLSPAARSSDGVTLSVTLDGDPLFDWAGRSDMSHRLTRIEMQAGQELDIAVGPGETARGDVTAYRFTLRLVE